MRRLIVNADDFGLTQGVNLAVAQAHSGGIVTSATLMANSPQFENAITLAKSHPQLGVGCHTVLINGQPTLPPSQILTLLDSSRQRFRESLSAFAGQAIFGRIDQHEITAEAVAQISKIQAAGIAVSHLDTHKHVHVLPAVLRPLLQAAKSQGIRAVRNPFEPLRISLLRGHARLVKQYVKIKILYTLAAQFRRAVTDAGMITTDGTIGILATGFMDAALLQHMINSLPEGTWELVCHPGYNDAELDAVATRLRQSRADELRLLTSPETRELLVRSGIQLISYRDLR